jgi:hypothetical protein
VVVPAAVSGIVAALIIGLSRGIGETMVVAIAAGAVGGSLFSLNPCQPGQTMTAAMTALARGRPPAGRAGVRYDRMVSVVTSSERSGVKDSVNTPAADRKSPGDRHAAPIAASSASSEVSESGRAKVADAVR